MFIYVLLLFFYTYTFLEHLCNVFVDSQKHSTIDTELCNMCYTLPCECTMIKSEHTQQQGKDL